MATCCSILVWKIPWTEEPGRLSPWDSKEPGTAELIHMHACYNTYAGCYKSK